MERSRLAVVGLGRIGLATAVAFSRSGRHVVGVDSNPDVLGAIRDDELPYVEPGLSRPALADIELRASIEELDWSTLDAWIICVGSNVDGHLDGSAVISVARSVIARARPEAVVAIESTIPPGTCDALADARPDVFVAHCPERGAPGNLLDELAAQPRLIGGTTREAMTAAHALYAEICTGTLFPCTAKEAEVAKLAENAYRAINVALAAEVAEAARRAGLDPQRTIALANTHPRVEILRPGLGAGGDCLPMATRWLAAVVEDGVAAGALRVDAAVSSKIVDLVGGHAHPMAKTGAKTVALLGTAYKPEIAYEHDVRTDPHTPAHSLYTALTAAGHDVASWDGLRADDDVAAFEAVVSTADVIVFGCAHRMFAEFDPAQMLALTRGSLAIDYVGAIDRELWRAAGWTVIG